MSVSWLVSLVIHTVMSVSQSLTETYIEESVTETPGDGPMIGLNIKDSFEHVKGHPWITKEFIAILGK